MLLTVKTRLWLAPSSQNGDELYLLLFTLLSRCTDSVFNQESETVSNTEASSVSGTTCCCWLALSLFCVSAETLTCSFLFGGRDPTVSQQQYQETAEKAASFLSHRGTDSWIWTRNHRKISIQDCHHGHTLLACKTGSVQHLPLFIQMEKETQQKQ